MYKTFSYDSLANAINKQPEKTNLSISIDSEKTINSINSIPSVKSVPPDLFNIIDLRRYLKLLSCVNEGDKLTFISDSVNIDKRYYLQGLRRWYTNDSRDATKVFIDKIVKSAEYYSNIKNIEDLDVLSKSLLTCKTGIENLCITYNDDKSFTSIMAINIELINMLANKMNNKRSYLN